MHTIRIIGPGRAGTSLAAALAARGWEFAGFLGRDDDLTNAARGVDVLVIATPDDAIADVAAAVVPVVTTTVVHLSGSLGLDALGAHPMRAAVHPLVPLPNGEVGAARLRQASRSPSPAPPLPTRSPPHSAAAPSRSPTKTGLRTTPPPASRRTTWSRSSARSSGWPPTSGSTSSPSCR